jgi:hypothetical protein
VRSDVLASMCNNIEPQRGEFNTVLVASPGTRHYRLGTPYNNLMAPSRSMPPRRQCCSCQCRVFVRVSRAMRFALQKGNLLRAYRSRKREISRCASLLDRFSSGRAKVIRFFRAGSTWVTGVTAAVNLGEKCTAQMESAQVRPGNRPGESPDKPARANCIRAFARYRGRRATI